MIVLGVIGWAMLRYSRKLPIAQFFAYSSALIAVLAVVLAGKGVAALQEAGIIDIAPLANFPRIAILGIFPSVQVVVAQLLALAVIAIGFWLNGRRSREIAAAASENADGRSMLLGERQGTRGPCKPERSQPGADPRL